ncbi:MAG: hypothetical protein ABW208_12325 [Pyrinomonadaceae bacterium]
MTQEVAKPPTCWFCGRRPPDRDSASEWEMHRETGVKDDEVASIARPEWEPVTVPVPRCAECKRAHERRETFVDKGWKTGLLVGVLVAVAALLAGLLSVTVAGLAFIVRRAVICVPAIVFGCAVAGGLVGWLFGKSSLPPGVRDQGTATLHPNIRRMESQGWKIGAKPRV